MSPNEETEPKSETSAATLSEGEEQTGIKTGKKPFIEPALSVSLNILDATAFFQGSAALDLTDV
jgi:hypothetical protein